MPGLDRGFALLQVLRAEGWASAIERLRARRAERQLEARAERLPLQQLAGLGVRVLNALPIGRSTRWGGVQVQLQARLLAEAHLRPVAVLSTTGSEYVLEGWFESGRRCFRTLFEARDLATAFARALEATGASVLHVESLASFGADGHSQALGTLIALDRLLAGRPTLSLIASLHDWAHFCPRPLLVERPLGVFCGFSKDPERCTACLGSAGAGQELGRLRRAALDLLPRFVGLVTPSRYLRDTLSLAPGLDSQRVHLIAPATLTIGAAVRRPTWPPRHAAFAGSVRIEKGAGIVAELAGLRVSGLRLSAYGGGDPAALARLRAAGVRVQGFYAPGSLGTRLVKDAVDVLLLPSLGPESYGLTLDEAWAVGLPAIAFDVGAPAERIRALGGGQVVPLEAGAQGFADALAAWRGTAAPPPVPTSLPRPESAARAHLELYAPLLPVS